jgi:hypothetical protein
MVLLLCTLVVLQKARRPAHDIRIIADPSPRVHRCTPLKSILEPLLHPICESGNPSLTQKHPLFRRITLLQARD